MYRLKNFNSYCCKNHQDMTKVKVGFNNMYSIASHTSGAGEPCTCNCNSIYSNLCGGTVVPKQVGCCASSHISKRSADFWKIILYLMQKKGDWNKLSCIKDKCVHCQFKLLPIFLREESDQNQHLVSWQQFEKVILGQTWDGKRKEVIKLEPKLTMSKEIILYAKPKLREFVVYNFIAWWQEKKYKKCM